MATDLHTTLLAAIETVERDAREVKASTAALVEVNACTCYGGSLPVGHEPGCGLEPGPAWYLAETALRFASHARRVLARHACYQPDDGEPYGCSYCGEPTACFDQADLAEALGIPTGGPHADH